MIDEVLTERTRGQRTPLPVIYANSGAGKSRLIMELIRRLLQCNNKVEINDEKRDRLRKAAVLTVTFNYLSEICTAEAGTTGDERVVLRMVYR